MLDVCSLLLVIKGSNAHITEEQGERAMPEIRENSVTKNMYSITVYKVNGTIKLVDQM